jgi:hypothetical protein
MITKWGRLIPKRCVLKVEDNTNLGRREIKRQAMHMVDWTNLTKAIRKMIKKRLVIVYTARTNIKDMLVNHKRIIESFTLDKPKCVCGNKRKHVAKRAKEWECWNSDILKLNCRYVPTPAYVDTQHECMGALYKWWNWLSKWDKTATLKGSVHKMAKDCINSDVDDSVCTTDDVRDLKRRLEG